MLNLKSYLRLSDGRTEEVYADGPTLPAVLQVLSDHYQGSPALIADEKLIIEAFVTITLSQGE